MHSCKRVDLLSLAISYLPFPVTLCIFAPATHGGIDTCSQTYRNRHRHIDIYTYTHTDTYVYTQTHTHQAHIHTHTHRDTQTHLCMGKQALSLSTSYLSCDPSSIPYAPFQSSNAIYHVLDLPCLVYPDICVSFVPGLWALLSTHCQEKFPIVFLVAEKKDILM